MNITDRDFYEAIDIHPSMVASRKQGKSGYEGCVNKETCKEYGFYLQKYSEEGLCSKCELVKFPERFSGCPFCREPHTLSYTCMYCSKGFIEWGMVSINFSSKYATDRSLFWLEDECTMALSTITKDLGHRMTFACNPLSRFGGWKGFYRGDNVWGLPIFEGPFYAHVDIDELVYTLHKVGRYGVSMDELSNLIVRKLKEAGLDLYSDVQLSPT